LKFVATLVLLALTLVFAYGQLTTQLPSFFYQTLALLLAGTLGIYFYLVDAKKEKPEYFVQLYMGTLFAKIIAYGAYMLFVVWEDRTGAADNVLFFMVGYFIFTAVEIIFLYLKVSR